MTYWIDHYQDGDKEGLFVYLEEEPDEEGYFLGRFCLTPPIFVPEEVGAARNLNFP